MKHAVLAAVLAAVMSAAAERVAIWPEGKMPDAQTTRSRP